MSEFLAFWGGWAMGFGTCLFWAWLWWQIRSESQDVDDCEGCP